MNSIWRKVNYALCLLAVAGLIVYLAWEDSIVAYEGISIAVFSLLLLLWMYAIVLLGRNLANAHSQPVYYGAALFPIF